MSATHRKKMTLLKFDRPLKGACLVKNDAVAGHNDRFDSIDRKNTMDSLELPVTGVDSSAISPLVLCSNDSVNQILELLKKIDEQLNHRSQQQSQIIEQFRELAINTSLMIAEAVVGYEVEHHETRIRNLLLQLIEQHQWQTPPAVYVNNLDLDRLRITLPDAPSMDSMLELKRDDSIAVGDCRVESSTESVTANFRRQLSEIQRQLTERLHDARPEPENHK